MRDVAFDTETWRIQPGRTAPKLVCMSWWDGENGGLLHRNDDAVGFFEREFLRNPDVRMIGHNVAFDCGVMVQAKPELFPVVFEAYEADRIVDTGIRALLRNIAKGLEKDEDEEHPGYKRPRYDLGTLCQEFLGETVEGKYGPDAWRFRYHELDEVLVADWPEAARTYAFEDARYTFRCWRRLQDFARTTERDIEAGAFDLEVQCRHAWWIHLMRAWGIRSDGEAVDALEQEIRGQLDKVMPRLVEAGIYEHAKDGKLKKNTKTLQRLISEDFTARGLGVPKTPPSSRFPQGQVKTDKEVLESCTTPLLVEASRVGSEASLLTGAIPLLRKSSIYPFNARWHPLKATGRTGCGEKEDPGNLQNLRRKGGVRECYVPRPGFVFLDADYTGAELCALAQVLLEMYGASEMANAILAGKDLHLDLAADILGLTYEEVLAQKKTERVKDARQLSKAGNFGFPGGLGIYKFIDYAKRQWGVIISEEQAKELKRRWLAKYPEMKQYFRDNGAATRFDDGVLVQHGSGRIRGGLKFQVMCNGRFQSLIADGAKSAGYQIIKECYVVKSSPLYGCRVTAFVHDEFLLEAPIQRARAAHDRLTEIMVERMQDFTPDIPTKTESALMRRWYKGAEPVFKNGKLVPWEPQAPGTVLRGVLADRKYDLATFARDTKLPEAVLSGASFDSLPDDWAERFVQVLQEPKPRDAVESWKAKQRVWALEQKAQERDRQLGYGPEWWAQ